MSSNNGADASVSEKTRSVLKSREEARRLEKKRNEEHKRIVESGQAINPKEAMARCFASGSHGNEALKGGGPH